MRGVGTDAARCRAPRLGSGGKASRVRRGGGGREGGQRVAGDFGDLHVRALKGREKNMMMTMTTLGRDRGVRASSSSSSSGKGFGGPTMEEKMEEVKANDMLIDALVEAHGAGEQQVLDVVCESLLALDKGFWMRYAMRTDSCESSEEKERMADLANLVMKITEKLVKQSEKSLDSAQGWLIKLLQQAADEQGQWHLPLNEGEIDKMRAFMKAKLMTGAQGQGEGGLEEGEEPCDMESLLATSYAWMKKAMEDEENREAQQVVPLLQKVLQLYASEFLLNFSSQAELALLQAENEALEAAGDLPSSQPAKEALEGLLMSNEEEWNAKLAKMASEEACSEDALLVELQKKKELIILGMSGGMYEQRVLVEYLQELEERVQSAFGGGKSESAQVA
ncbi:hypothetical protein HOP50_01g09130 [Chloropicon primus]|uniref:Uncharacterized protein n=2 Tax=Chloropicon primus TaxID=1764295 RepID=A0A5B8MDA8_9CHLO|nr:hypothetical protein A3770_01p09250 [Chloropicon primus]UPQ97618.1 hypothetical protein HOP50_01g09130 [Chloropicon primus]|eukprot:QDZ18407.1 hypothetical protein A3770_01p09250 [Chloropicon primus]